MRAWSFVLVGLFVLVVGALLMADCSGYCGWQKEGGAFFAAGVWLALSGCACLAVKAVRVVLE